MKVRVEDIKEEGLSVEEDISGSSWEIDSFDVKFVDNIHLDGRFQRAGAEILVNVDLVMSWEVTCSRCLEVSLQTSRQACVLSYNTDSLGEYLDIDSDVREEIILKFPMKALCIPECKGLCSGCGVNLNKEGCKCNK